MNLDDKNKIRKQNFGSLILCVLVSVGSFLLVYDILQLLLRKRLRISKTTTQVCASIIKVELNEFPDLLKLGGS